MKTEIHWRVTAQSTGKKSQASIVDAGCAGTGATGSPSAAVVLAGSAGS
jgi:hypothetical protein